ncbi:MAG: T9SS type A sorting domain-containing protein [Ignavibacteria bacterium]|nr:T9SS type A sorting domain-containing protein [Ignavibacteria bacterium]
MEKNILLIVLLLLPAILFSQVVEDVKLSGPVNVLNPDWGTNILISNITPYGAISGVKTSSGTIWLAVNDTALTTSSGIILFKSTNNGLNWVLGSTGIGYRTWIKRIEMIKTPNDSVFCFFNFGNNVYVWNLNNNIVKNIDTNHTNLAYDFDVTSTSNNSMYLFTVPVLRYYSSTDYGVTWLDRGIIESNARNPSVAKSKTGDSLYLSYRAPVITPVVNSSIKIAGLYEPYPGTLYQTSAGIQTLLPAGTNRGEFKPASANGVVWMFYTEGTTGNINIYCMTSTNSGINYSTPINVAANPNVDEYWFDVDTRGNGASCYCDFIWYADSLQSGPSTNYTDKLLYKYSSFSAPNYFTGLTQISQYPPFWANNLFIPIIIEIPTNILGAAWVGLNGPNKQLFWNRSDFASVIQEKGIKTELYSLSQNYPNPFNPSTKIDFAIPKSGFVNLKVYDLLGRKVIVLISKQMNAGSYTLDLDASSLTSGVYFYKLEVNGFVDVKNMTVLK